MHSDTLLHIVCIILAFSLDVYSAEELINLLFSSLPREAVLLLEQIHQLFALAFDPIEIIVGDFSPALLDFAAEFSPIALDHVHSYHGIRLLSSYLNFSPGLRLAMPASPERFFDKAIDLPHPLQRMTLEHMTGSF
jgi:hypothetical protein